MVTKEQTEQTEQTETPKKKIPVYTRKYVMQLYKEVTGQELRPMKLTRLVQRGYLRAYMEPGDERSSYIYKEDVDNWIKEIKEQNTMIHIVA